MQQTSQLSFTPRHPAIPAGIKLADPKYFQSRHIDILIGSETFWDLICEAEIKLETTGPILQETKFDWIISGTVCTSTGKNPTICNHSLNNLIEVKGVPHLEDTNSNKICKQHFTATYRWD